MAVLNRLVRLSYWERIQSVLPEEFRQLLPPKPEVAALPAAEAGEDPEAAAADPEEIGATLGKSLLPLAAAAPREGAAALPAAPGAATAATATSAPLRTTASRRPNRSRFR